MRNKQKRSRRERKQRRALRDSRLVVWIASLRPEKAPRTEPAPRRRWGIWS